MLNTKIHRNKLTRIKFDRSVGILTNPHKAHTTICPGWRKPKNLPSCLTMAGCCLLMYFFGRGSKFDLDMLFRRCDGKLCALFLLLWSEWAPPAHSADKGKIRFFYWIFWFLIPDWWVCRTVGVPLFSRSRPGRVGLNRTGPATKRWHWGARIFSLAFPHFDDSGGSQGGCHLLQHGMLRSL